MLSRDVYEIIHVIGIALVMLAIGGIASHATDGGRWTGPGSRRPLKLAHHVGLFLILLGGFGMLARIGIAKDGIASFPVWLWLKLALFVLLGATVALPYRRPQWAWPAFFATPVIAGLAVYLALYKPFL